MPAQRLGPGINSGNTAGSRQAASIISRAGERKLRSAQNAGLSIAQGIVEGGRRREREEERRIKQQERAKDRAARAREFDISSGQRQQSIDQQRMAAAISMNQETISQGESALAQEQMLGIAAPEGTRERVQQARAANAAYQQQLQSGSFSGSRGTTGGRGKGGSRFSGGS